MTQLFNYREDPWETRDLSACPEQAERLTQMRREMRQAARYYGDEGDQLIDHAFDFWKRY